MSPLGLKIQVSDFTDTKQRPFKTLISCFKRSLLVSVLQYWLEQKLVDLDKLDRQLAKELTQRQARLRLATLAVL